MYKADSGIDRRAFLAGMLALGGVSALGLGSGAYAADPVKSMTLVLDDVGGSKSDIPNLRALQEKNVPLTFAFLPYRSRKGVIDKAAAIVSDYEAAQIILHQPMQPIRPKDERYMQPEDEKEIRGLFVGDSEAAIRKRIGDNIEYINDIMAKFGPKRVVGLNNHVGSKATQDEALTRAVAEYACKNGLYVLDSFTIASSVLHEAGDGLDCDVYKRDGSFLDDASAEEVMRRIDELDDMKAENLIGIGHIKKDPTIDAIIKFHERSKHGETSRILANLV